MYGRDGRGATASAIDHLFCIYADVHPFSHDDKSYSYRFETPHGSIVFTGDTGPSDAVARLVQGADVLVSEVEDVAAIGAFVDRMAVQYHWSPEHRNQFRAHMTEEHLDVKDVGQRRRPR